MPQPTTPPVPGGSMLLHRPPLWQQAMDRIAEQIRSGQLPPGAALPAERELCAQFGTSHTTVRRALAELRAAGLVTIRMGKGAFVAADWNSPRCPTCGAARPQPAAISTDPGPAGAPDVVADRQEAT